MDHPPTLVTTFSRRVAESGDRSALLFHRQDAPCELTWNQLAELVQSVGAALVRLAVQPGDRVVQLAENRFEWIVCDLAAAAIGAVHVPLHASLSGEQVVEQLLDCEGKILLLSGAEQAGKLRPLADRLPAGLRYFAFEPVVDSIGGAKVGSWEELAGTPGKIPDGVQPEGPDQLATIIYTSGTTGEPKGVMLSHGNLELNARQVLSRFNEQPADVRLTFLPWSHVFARTCDLYTWIGSGVRLALARSRETLLADCAYWKPTLINGVPLFYERLRRQLQQSGMADRLGAIRHLLGGKIAVCCCGGAALSDSLYDYYLSQEVPLLQGYGLTETSPVISLSTPGEYRRGSIGRPLPLVEVRLAKDGEIVTRGPHVMQGYWGRPDETRRMVQDGWLHTGDLGRMDGDGYLYITGRKREILVTSGGKNVAPVRLESLLTEDPLILQALVVGDGRDYLAALIVPDLDTLRAHMRQLGIEVSGPESKLHDPCVLQMYERCVDERLAGVGSHEKVRRFTLLPRGFTVESGELTQKMSLRRAVIEANFRREIDALYSG